MMMARVAAALIAAFISTQALAQTPPVVNPINVVASPNTSFPAANFLSVQSTNPIVAYEIWQATPNTGNYFYVNGVREPARTDYTLTAAQWAQTTFSVATTNEINISIRAEDSKGNWSHPYNGYWALASVTLSVPGPVILAENTTSPQFTEFDLSRMFTATLDQGRPITEYEAISTSGGLIVNGAKIAPGATASITPEQMATALVETTNVNDTIQLRAYDGYNWGAWKSFTITLSNVYGPHVIIPTAGLGQIDTNMSAVATAKNPVPTTRRVLVDWVNNLGHPIQIVRVAASLGLPMSSPFPVGQYIYAVQIIRMDGSGEVELVYPGGAQNYTANDSANLPWNDYRDFPDPGLVVQPGDKLHFLMDGYTTGPDFTWQVNFQVYFK